MFFESLAECSLSFTYVCVAAVDVTRDVIDGSTLVLGGHIHQTESPYHEQRSGIPSACHLQSNHPAEI